MAPAIVIRNTAEGVRPNGARPLAYHVLWTPAPATESTTLIALCTTEADANAVAALHPA